LARSEHRKTITAAISSGSASRRAGGLSLPLEHVVARLSGALRLLVGEAAGREPGLVAVGPGVIAFERIPSFA